MTLRVENLRAGYGNTLVIDQINLRVKPGTICGLMGRNGSGKTTLLRCINGVLPPKKGKIFLLDEEISRLNRSQISQRIGLVPQVHFSPFSFSCMDMVLMACAARINPWHTPGKRDRQKALAVMAETGIDHMAKRAYNSLSGGERQLVMLARGLFQETPILLLDEPNAHLDFANQHKVMALMQTLVKQKNLTVLITLHDPNLVHYYCDEVILLHEGSVIASGPPPPHPDRPGTGQGAGRQYSNRYHPKGAVGNYPETYSLHKKFRGDPMKCNYCERRCDLTKTNGFCGMYKEEKGAVVERYPNRWCTYFASRVESVPFYHAYPGSRSMIIGTGGCNFRCSYCSNGFIACQNPDNIQEIMYEFAPEKLVAMAQKLGCHNIVFNVNEPTVSLPSLARVKEYAQKADLPMGCLTNGYTTQEATRMMADIFSFVHVGLKGFSNNFYQRYVGIDDMAPILRNIETFSKRCHLEIASPVIEDVNDHELHEIAQFIHDINPQIPWHVFRLLPEHNMKASLYPNIERMSQALESARILLPYIYFHNFVGSDWVNTLCPHCKTDVIKRFSLGCSGDQLDEFLAPGNTCPACGAKIALLGTKVAWNEKQYKPDSGGQKI